MLYKKANMEWVVGILISIIILVLLISIANDYIKKKEYETSLLECSFFLKSFPKTVSYFSSDLSKPNQNLLQSVQKLCPSKDFEITNKNIRNSINLIEDCYIKSAKGFEILPPNSQDMGICLYCGKIISKDEIDDFDLKFSNLIERKESEFLFEDSQTKNLNNLFLKNTDLIPSQINSKKSIGVFYYQYSPEIKCGGNLLDWENFNLKGCGTKIEISFNKFLNSNFAGIVNNYITFDSNNQGIISGLFLVNLEEKNGDDFKFLAETDSNIENIFGENFPIQDCNFIIPQKNFKAD